MGNTPYRDIPGKMKGQKDFVGNSMRGFNTTEDEYLVKSYATVVGGWHRGIGWWVRDEHYSVTTSRHQNIIRSLGAVELSWEEYCERAKAFYAGV